MTTDEKPFFHARFCPRLAARHTAAFLLDMLAFHAEVLATRGRALAWNRSRPGETAYYLAQRRLRKAGLIALRDRDGRRPTLVLTEAGRAALDPATRPAPYWNARWRGTWFLLAYDVPEKDRRYRDVLRRFLRRLRMGSLQGSVWISPRDIRPDYADLATATAVDDVAVLFEARIVPGHTPRQVVEQAWDFETLAEGHRWYLQAARSAMKALPAHTGSRAGALAFAREELAAYRSVMAADPLLPRSLWPPGYLGERVWHTHRDLQKAVARLRAD